MTPEGKIKKMFNDRLKAAFGKQVWRFMPVQRGYGMPALDYLLCAAGRFIAVETKRDATAKLSPRQVATIKDMHLAWAKVFVVYDSETCDRVITYIRTLIDDHDRFSIHTKQGADRPGDTGGGIAIPRSKAA